MSIENYNGESEQAIYFNDDREKFSPDDDLLNRKHFCSYIANSINQWRNKENLVIAIYGSWGSGKSTIKNFIVKYLYENGEKLKIIEFNPWIYKNQEQIIFALFKELEIVLDTFVGECAKECTKSLRKYANIISKGKMVFNPALNLLDLLQGLPISSGAIADIKAKDIEEKLKKAADSIEKLEHYENTSLSEIKKNVEEHMRNLDTPILVIIDEIDRLTSDEIRLIFKLVKSTICFPNLIFLLLCDREYVEKCLDEDAHEKGKDYLEKIVQVGFNVPEISNEKLLKLLKEELEKFHDFFVSEFPTELDRIKIFENDVIYFFSNLRDVKRFCSSLNFHISLFKGQESYSISYYDLFFLELLRVFYPAVYRNIYLNKEFLIKTIMKYNIYPKDIKKSVNIFEKFTETVNEEFKVHLNNLLYDIFPQTGIWTNEDKKRPFVNKEEFTQWKETMKKLKRVCSGSYFDRYFNFFIPS